MMRPWQKKSTGMLLVYPVGHPVSSLMCSKIKKKNLNKILSYQVEENCYNIQVV